MQVDFLNPTETRRRYSSIWARDNKGHGHARSKIDSPQAWSAQHNRVGEWMQVDLGAAYKVAGFQVQGRRGHDQRVTEMSVSVSQNGRDFTPVDEGRLWKYNQKYDGKDSYRFAKPVLARFVRITAQHWHGHVSMRAGILVVHDSKQANTETNVKLDNVAENRRTYSSIWGNNAIGTGHARSRIDSVQAWSARNNRAGEWMTMDLSSTKKVKGVQIQGRRDHDQVVTSFTVSVSTDGHNFHSIDGGRVFKYNSKHSGLDNVWFANEVNARYVRIVVASWHNHVSMRAGVLLA